MKLIGLILGIVLILNLSFLSSAIVPLSHAFHGTVTYENGTLVKEVNITAKIHEIIVETGKVTNGKFGYSENFIVEQDHGDLIYIYFNENVFGPWWLTPGKVTNLEIVLHSESTTPQNETNSTASNTTSTNQTSNSTSSINSKSNKHQSAKFLGYCDVDWECSGWSECNGEFMTRICTDTNNCVEKYNKPIEELDCKTLTTQKVLVEKNNQNMFLFFEIILAFLLFLILVVLIILTSKKSKK